MRRIEAGGTGNSNTTQNVHDRFVQVIFERLRVSVTRVLSRAMLESMTIESRENFLVSEVEGLVLTLHASVVSDKVITNVKHFRWPETWWDAFKHKYFSDSMLKHWPVKWHEERIECQEIRKCCPHLSVSNDRKHLEWFMYEGGLPTP